MADKRGVRIDVPPPRSAAAHIPDDFGRRFLVFVDTEEEFDWSRPLARENTAVTAMAGLPDAQRFFREAGVQCLYMTDWPVIDDDHAAGILRRFHDEDGCEIGTQLHPWVSPPFDEQVTGPNSFTGNLPLALQREKLFRLTARIAEQIGTPPTVYRAGRYGIGKHTAQLLEEAGYRMDASVRARFDYSGEQGPDFSRHGLDPFWAGPRGALLELPLSAAYVGGLKRGGDALFGLSGRLPLIRSLLARSGLMQRIALTPEGFPLDDAREAIRAMLGDGVRIFSLSFHSPSVVPGHTPYVRDAVELADFYRWWDGVLDLFAREGVTPARASDVVAAADRAR